MNKQERKELVSYKITRAKETLCEIELHIHNKLWINAVNRFYYACFYAVTVFLLDNEIESQIHSGTKQMFGLHFVKPGLIEPEYGRVYSTLFNLRQTSVWFPNEFVIQFRYQAEIQ